MPCVGRNCHGVPLAHFHFFPFGAGVFNAPLNDHQNLGAVGVVVARVALAGFEHATADCHLGRVAKRPSGEPGEVAPVKSLFRGLGICENLDVRFHGLFFFLVG